MAVRKPAAPVKQKIRKNHGPKRKMFHCYSKTARVALAKCGLLTKYENYESFVLACAARGVRTKTDELWATFKLLPTKYLKDKFLKELK